MDNLKYLIHIYIERYTSKKAPCFEFQSELNHWFITHNAV